jgi:hypothetical protein
MAKAPRGWVAQLFLKGLKTQLIRDPQCLIKAIDQTLIQQVIHQPQGLIAIGMFGVCSQRSRISG